MASSNLIIKIKAVDQASRAMKSIQSGIIRLVGAVVALGAAFKAITFPAQEAATFERRMVDVAKTTNFTDQQIEKLSGTMIQLSKSMSLSASELASIAAVAGQLGLGSFGVEAIEKFTESVARASVTLGLSVEKAAEFGAQITSIFNIDPTNIENVFSLLNELSNTSVATAGQLADIIKRIGSVGGVTLQQSGALAAFFRDMGVQVEVIGTSTVKVLSNMSAKAKQFAEVAGVSTKEWLELMEQDTVTALTTVTSKLHEMDRAQRDATAKELFGSGRILSTFTKLIDEAGNGYARLQGHIDSANASFALGTSSIVEYDKVMLSLSEQTKVMFNSARALAIEMGENLTPVMLEIVKDIQGFLASDKGRDFFFQMSEGIKAFIVAIKNGIRYIANFGIQWANVFQTLKNLLYVMITMSGYNLARSIGIGLGGLIVKLNTLVGGMSAVAAASATASAGVRSLGASIAFLFKRFFPIIAVLSAVTALVTIFYDEIRQVLGLKSKVQLEAEAEVRIDRRKTEEEVRGAINTISDLAKGIVEQSKVEIKVPIKAAPLADQIEFDKATLANIKNSSNFLRQLELLKAKMPKVVETALSNLKAQADVQVSLIATGDDEVQLKDLENQIDNLRDKISKGSGGNMFAALEDKKTLDSLEKEYHLVASRIFNNFGSLGKIKGNEFYEGLISRNDDIVAKYEAVVSGIEAEIVKAVNSGKSIDTLSDDLAEAVTKLDGAKESVSAVNTELYKMVEVRTALNQALLKQILAEDALQKNADIYEQRLGTKAATEAAEITIELKDIDEQRLQLAEAINNKESSGVDIQRRKAELIKATGRLEELNERKKALYTSALGEGQKNRLAGIFNLQKADAQVTLERIKQNDITEETTDSIEEQNRKIVESLQVQVRKRDQLRRQINNFNDATRDAVSIADRMDGAWDNAAKTIRSMHDSMESFGQKIDEILRKRKSSEATEEFNLGIDKQLTKDIDEITKKYDALIAKTQEAGGGGAKRIGQFTVIRQTVEELEKQRDLEIEMARDKAKNSKLDNKRAVAEAEIKRTLDEQAKAQKEFADASAKISAKNAAGEFKGADGIEEYRKSMLELESAQKKVDETSQSARNALVDLANVKGTDDTDVRKYEESLEKLDKTTIKLKEDGINLQKELADGTKTLIGSELKELTTPYDALNKSINDLVGTNAKLRDLVNGLTTALANTNPQVTSTTASLEDQNNAVIKLANSYSKLDDVYPDTDSIAKITDAFKKLADNKEVNTAEIKITPVADTSNIDGIVDSIQSRLPKEGIGANIKVDKVVWKNITEYSDGTPDFPVGVSKFEADGNTPITYTDGSSAKVPVGSFIVKADTTVETEGTEGVSVDAKANITAIDTANLKDAKVDLTVDLKKENVEKELEEGAKGMTVKDAVFKNATVQGTIKGPGFAAGGSITGPGSGTSDSILSWLSNGEYVIKASSVAKFGTSFFDLLNSGMLPKFASGGLATAGSGGSSTAAPDIGSVGSVTLNLGGKGYTLYGERQQAKELVSILKKMDRG